MSPGSARPRLRWSTCLGVVAFSWLSFGPLPPAAAYVRTLASGSGLPLTWRQPCVGLEVLVGSTPASVSSDLFRQATNEAAAAWSSSRVACTKMSVTVVASPASKGFVEADRVNKVQFLTGSFWGRTARDEVDRLPYPSNALAITSVFADRNTGQIVDTDIEINGTGPSWADLVANPDLRRSSNTHDLQNTLTHELGHVVGLDHTCDGGGQVNLTDHRGNTVPPCPGPPEVQETTMAAIVAPGDTERRSLAADDREAVCAVYPDDGKSACGSDDSGFLGGCSYGATPKTPAFFLFVLGAAALGGSRRRKQRRV